MADVVSPIIKTITAFITVGEKVYKINSEFKLRMEILEERLKSLEQMIERFEKLDDPTYRENVEDLKSKLEEGQRVIKNCTEVTASRFFEKPSLTKDLNRVIDNIHHAIQVLELYTKVNWKEKYNDGCAIESETCELPKSPQCTAGLRKPLEELNVELLTEGKSVLVLTGPGGFGKTTLANELCKYKDVKGKFGSNIFFVRIPKYFKFNSKDPDERRQRENVISGNILQKLHQCMLSRAAGSSPRGEAPAIGLKEFLTQAGETPLLLVFDGVTPKTEFLIERFHDESKKIKMQHYKILVTSRSKLSRFDSYYMKSWKKEDAMSLLEKLLGDQCGDVSDDIKKEVVEHCKGLPQAIEGVVRILRGQPAESWRTKRDKMKSGSVLDFVHDLLYLLQSSVDALDEIQSTVKKCFMDLCVFLKDQPIPAAALIDIWTELHELEGEDNESIENLNWLTERCLVNLLFPRRDNTKVEEDGGYYSQHFVSQHDILRDLTIRQSNLGTRSGERLVIDVPKKSFPKWWKESMYQQPVHARLVSISTEREFPKEWDTMKLPKAEVLVLHFQAETYALPKFLNTMSESLKVLIVTNHGQVHAKVSEFRLLGSITTLKRIRLEGISIPSMKKNSMEVKSLLKISLFMCDFDEASSKSSIKLSKAFPNLVEINIDYCNNLKELPAELCGLKKLKKLSITNCDKLHALPEEIGNLVQLEILRLLACIKLLQLPCSISKLRELKLFNISDCWSIKEWPDIGGMDSLETLIVRHCPGLRKLPSDWPRRVKVIFDEEKSHEVNLAVK